MLIVWFLYCLVLLGSPSPPLILKALYAPHPRPRCTSAAQVLLTSGYCVAFLSTKTFSV